MNVWMMSKIKFIHAIYLEEINFGKIENGKMKKINRDRKSEIKEQKGEVRKIMGENKEKIRQEFLCPGKQFL